MVTKLHRYMVLIKTVYDFLVYESSALDKNHALAIMALTLQMILSVTLVDVRVTVHCYHPYLSPWAD